MTKFYPKQLLGPLSKQWGLTCEAERPLIIIYDESC